MVRAKDYIKTKKLHITSQWQWLVEWLLWSTYYVGVIIVKIVHIS